MGCGALFVLSRPLMLEYSLLLRKAKDGSVVKSSLSDFGFAVRGISWPEDEIEEVATREWPGEHGEDAYISPDGLKLKAYDLEVEFCYKGGVNTAYEAYTTLRDYLIGDGGFMLVYDPYWRKGRQGVYVKKFHDHDPHRTNIDEVLTMKVTFRVTDPKNEIRLSYVGD